MRGWKGKMIGLLAMVCLVTKCQDRGHADNLDKLLTSRTTAWCTSNGTNGCRQGEIRGHPSQLQRDKLSTRLHPLSISLSDTWKVSANESAPLTSLSCAPHLRLLLALEAILYSPYCWPSCQFLLRIIQSRSGYYPCLECYSWHAKCSLFGYWAFGHLLISVNLLLKRSPGLRYGRLFAHLQSVKHP